jgi:hypothetical protein
MWELKLKLMWTDHGVAYVACRLRSQLAGCTCAVAMAASLASCLRSFEWPGCLHASPTLRSFLGLPPRATLLAPILKPLPVSGVRGTGDTDNKYPVNRTPTNERVS